MTVFSSSRAVGSDVRWAGSRGFAAEKIGRSATLAQLFPFFRSTQAHRREVAIAFSQSPICPARPTRKGSNFALCPGNDLFGLHDQARRGAITAVCPESAVENAFSPIWRHVAKLGNNDGTPRARHPAARFSLSHQIRVAEQVKSLQPLAGRVALFWNGGFAAGPTSCPRMPVLGEGFLSRWLQRVVSTTAATAGDCSPTAFTLLTL